MALFLSIVHVLACLLIIGVILVQSGKGGGMGAGFGGASAAATQLFGGRGAGNFLTRSTVGLAMVFMITSLSLAYLSSRPNSLLDLSETSGREAPDEDTVVEEGSGELIELSADGSAAEPSAEAAEGGEPIPLKLEIPPIVPADGSDEAEAPTEPAPPVVVDVKPEPKPEAKPEPTPEAKPEPKPEPKPEAKPAPKPEAKPEPKPEAKPEPKPEPKPEAKPDPKPEAKPEPAEDPEEPADEEAPPTE